MKQTQQNLFLLKYRMAPSYNPEIIYLYVFRIQLTVLRNSYLVKIYELIFQSCNKQDKSPVIKLAQDRSGKISNPFFL